MKVKSVETMTIRRHKELMDNVEQCHTEKVSVWKETFRENTNSLTNDVKVAEAVSVRISMV